MSQEIDNPAGPKALRKYCQQLGITPATSGRTINELIELACKTEDPRGWLAALIDAPPEEETARELPISADVNTILIDGEVFLNDGGKFIDPVRVSPAGPLVLPAEEKTEQSAIAAEIANECLDYHGASTRMLAAIVADLKLPPDGPDPEFSIRFGMPFVSLSIPVHGEEPTGYLEREMHLDVRLGPAASRAFRRVWHALDKQNARLSTGRHVGKSRADVVRWIFEQVAAALETNKDLLDEQA